MGVFKIKTKFLTIPGIILLAGALMSAAFAANPIKLIVNGQEIKTDVSPRLIDGRTMVPVRWVAEAMHAEVSWDGEKNTVTINKPYAVAGVPEAKTFLYPFKEENGMYDGFIMELDGKRVYFDWRNSSNPTYAPQLFFSDINQDGEKELIVVLTTATGTGLHQEVIHVINPQDFVEVKVEDPLDVITRSVRTEIIEEVDEEIIKFEIDGQTVTVRVKKGAAGDLNDKVIFSNVNHYGVVDNELSARAAAQVSITTFVGEIEIKYMFDGNEYKAKTVEFRPY